ncbi:hypothetical protein HGRIS_011071 [Hohenbuehelia grisea]
MLATFLLGILAMQVYYYCMMFPKDQLWNKVAVSSACSLELIGTVFTMVSAWHMLGAGWGDPDVLSSYYWTQTLNWVIAPFADTIIQIFFAFQIYKLTKEILIPITIFSLALLAVILGLYTGIKVATEHTASLGDNMTFILINVSLAATVVCNILIAASTVTILVRASRKTRFRSTKLTLRRLIILAVETGTVTASSGILELVLSRTTTGGVQQLFGLIGDKLYAIAMLAALNSRAASFDNRPEFIGMSNIQWTTHTSTPRPSRPTLFDDEYASSEETSTSTRKSTQTSPTVINIAPTVTFSRRVSAAGDHFVLEEPKDDFEHHELSLTRR